MKLNKVLVIRLSSLGDILLTFPVYKSIKEKYPKCHISVLTKPQFSQIPEAARYVDEVILFDGFFQTLSLINASRFDLLIDLHANVRSFLISLLSKVPLKIRYKKDSLWRRLFVNWRIISPSLEKHTIDRYLQCLEQIGITDASRELFIDDFKPVKPDNNDRKFNFLLVQTAFLGDSMLSLPLAKALKENFPGCKITALIRSENSEFFSRIDEIDELVEDRKKTAPKITEFFRLLGELRKRKFDAAIIPHRSLRSALLVYMASIKKRIGFNFGLWSFLFTDPQPFSWTMHDAERNMMLLAPLKTLCPPSFPRLKADSEIPRQVQELPIKIAINPSSAWETKKWPREYFVSIIRKIKESYNIASILIGSVKEIEYNLGIEKELPQGYCINLTGKTSLISLISLIKKCDLLITNDSGPMHIAAAVKTPTIAIFGPTSKELGFFPYSDRAVVIEEKLACRPCRLHGSKKCPEKHFLCMRLITPGRVFSEVEKLLEYKS